jgi:hypothetical protein
MVRGPRSRSRKLGKRLGIALLAAFVSIPTAVWTLQIMRAVWAPPPGPAPKSCPAGVAGLLDALDRAKAAVNRASQGERESLQQFRQALQPEWASRGAVGEICRDRPDSEVLLREIDGLRYAEEHAIRYEASALAGQRLKVRELTRDLRREKAVTE